MGPEPLGNGTLVHERFEITGLLGRGGFGITYLCRDLERGDACALKELAPEGSRRELEGRLTFDALGAAQAQRLRQQFASEGELLARLRIRGVIPGRGSFRDLGTVYVATDFLTDSLSLDKVLARDGRLDPSATLDIVMQLLETLEDLHARGILHRDLKPSNVLLTPRGDAVLIDFGSARAWHADLSLSSQPAHTVIVTPGYAPLEQMSERARRGPGTDLYGLCAMAYAMLTGSPPPPAPERAAGVPLTPIREIRPDVEAPVASALEAGLSLRLEDRPATIEAFRDLLAIKDEPSGGSKLESIERRLIALQSLNVGRRECPVCHGVLEEPKPLKAWQCPVCREGRIRERKLSGNACPNCRTGVLHRRANADPPCICPACGVGLLKSAGGLLGLGRRSWRCSACQVEFEARDGGWGRQDRPDEPARTWDEWRLAARRSDTVYLCDACPAQYDELPDGRRRQVVPEPTRYRVLDPLEWSLVAEGLEPGDGNAECDACQADFFLDGDQVTILRANLDPYAIATEEKGRPHGVDAWRWIGVGKPSGSPGLVCASCHTEFDQDEGALRLVATRNRTLAARLEEAASLETWHRWAQDLPEAGHDDELIAELADAVREAYVAGELAFDTDRAQILWQSPARRGETKGSLTWQEDELVFSYLLRKQRWPISSIEEVATDGTRLLLTLAEDDVELAPEPVVLELEIGRQRYPVRLGVEELAARLDRARSG